jgi:signal transduction histidine kinase
MRLLPASLFARLVLVLLAGLLVAQLLSFAIHMEDRGELLLQAGGVQSAQRVADIVRVLESQEPVARRKILRVLSSPALQISLDAEPMAPVPQAGLPGSRAEMFSMMVRGFLGDGRPVETTVAESAPTALRDARGPGGGFARMHGPFNGAMHAPGQPGLSFVSQVRLRDGTLVTFDARQSSAAASLPSRMVLSLAVLLVAVVALSLLAVRWATRPLKALADAADDLGRNIHRAPMAESGPLEVVRAARAFNTMQVRLTAYLRERTSVLAAMSHDLKTPVTRLRLRAELLADPQLRRKFTDDLQEMESMVAATLEFLRGTAGSEVAQPVDMTALLESLQADLAEVGSRIDIEGRALRPYTGQPTALKRCVRNLVENAVKYGRAVSVVLDDNDDRLQILVRDEGPGIPESELERVFDPFYRLEGSRSRDTGGTGLGLTIARSIAESHGGRLTLENRPAGGLDARLTLPRYPGGRP